LSRSFAAFRSPSAIVVFETVAVGLFQFGTYWLLIRFTDAKVIGLWVLVNSLLSMARIADFWSRGLSSFAGQARGRGSPEDAHAYVVTAIASAGMAYLVAALAAFPAVWLAAGWIGGAGNAPLIRSILPLMIVTFWLSSMAAIYQLGFLGFERPGLKALQTIGGALLFLAFSLVLAPRFGIWGILLAQAIQAGLMLLYAVIAYHGVLARGLGRARWTRKRFDELALYGIKAAVVGVFQLASEPVIRVIANAFGGLAAVALVELASRLILLVRGVILSLGQILVPAFARLGHDGEKEVSRLLVQTERMFLMLGVAAFSLLLSAAPLAGWLILGVHADGFAAILWLLGAGWFANLLSGPAYFLLAGRRHLRPLLASHMSHTLGAAAFGWTGGTLFGFPGALAGISLALLGASALLYRATMPARETGLLAVLLARPWTLAPLAGASLALAPFWSAMAQGPLSLSAIAIASVPLAATLLLVLATFPIRQVLHNAVMPAQG
jgi:O-antigen/teichoic acid export membrane protein